MRPDSDDALERFVLFLSSTESRNKIYRLIQYSAKMTKWVIMTTWKLTPDEIKATPPLQTNSKLKSMDDKQHREQLLLTLKNGQSSKQEEQSPHSGDKVRQRASWLAGMLARIESLFGDARKVYRFFQFLEMMDLFRHVNDADPSVRLLRRLRVLCFFFFYLFENYMVFLLRVEGFPSRHPRVVMLKRSCNGFWCASILLAFALDHITQRGSVLSTMKKLLDLPVAYIAFADKRLSDGLFGLLGIASAEIGVYLRWVDVMAKLRHKKLLSQGKLVLRDVS